MFAFLQPYMPLFVLSIIFSLLIVIFESGTLWIVTTLIQTLFKPEQQAAITSVTTHLNLDAFVNNANLFLKACIARLTQASTPVETLSRVCIILVITFLCKNIFIYVNSLLLAFMNLEMVKDLRNALYTHVLRLPVSYYDRNRSGEIISKIMNDVGGVNSALTNTLSKMITEPIRLVVFWTLLFWINWKMSLLVILILPILTLIIVAIGKSVRRRSKRAFENISGVYSVLQETVTGIRAVKMFNMNEAESAKFNAENQQYTKNSFKQVRSGALNAPITEVFGLLVAAALLWYGGSQVLMGHGMSADDFTRYLFILIYTYQPLKAIGGINNSLQNGLAAAERIFAVIDSKPEHLVTFKEENVPSFTKDISFANVTFTYPGCEDVVLHDISFSIPKGNVVALVGASGSGKTTIFDLVPRFYEIEKGSISIDGIDVRSCDLVGLRQLFGIVSQGTFLFNDTVFNNIAYGHKASEEAVMKAAEMANAVEFIDKLPNKVHTNIGERGVMLSGGQCQRLAIARALLRNPPILILDEATSALDTESERLVQHAIDNLMKDRTVLVVAHRLSTIRNANKILVLDKGVISEQGTHEELLALGKRYTHFHSIQFAAHKKPV